MVARFQNVSVSSLVAANFNPNFEMGPVLTTPTAITYTDTSVNNTFSITTGTLSATDADGHTLTYGIAGGTTSTGVSSKSGSYGTLSVNTSTGAYSFSPSDAGIEALKTDTSETFTVTPRDGTFGTSATFTVNLTGANDTPTGNVTITGTATQGQTLTASNTLADIDGLGTISYQWSAAGTAITGATGSALVLGQAQVGKAITVSASYTDGYASAESVASSATAALAAAKVTIGTPGGDTFTASASHDILDGGTGIDTVIFSNSAAAYDRLPSSRTSVMTAISLLLTEPRQILSPKQCLSNDRLLRKKTIARHATDNAGFDS